MEQLKFAIEIKAPASQVWDALWKDTNYRAWTNVFSEGSYAVSDWEEGSAIKFLSADGGGMSSTIERMIPGQFMSFRHHGELKNGIEVPVTEEAREWIGAMENYTLNDLGNHTTELKVEMDISPKHADFFREAFPKALEKVKVIAELYAVSSR